MVIRLSVMADQDDSSLLNKSSPIALTCEDFYTKRVRYLERFRERHESLTTPTSTPTSSYRLSKSANSINEYLSNNSLSSDISSSTSERNHGSNFVQLGNDMVRKCFVFLRFIFVTVMNRNSTQNDTTHEQIMTTMRNV